MQISYLILGGLLFLASCQGDNTESYKFQLASSFEEDLKKGGVYNLGDLDAPVFIKIGMVEPCTTLAVTTGDTVAMELHYLHENERDTAIYRLESTRAPGQMIDLARLNFAPFPGDVTLRGVGGTDTAMFRLVTR